MFELVSGVLEFFTAELISVGCFGGENEISPPHDFRQKEPVTQRDQKADNLQAWVACFQH